MKASLGSVARDLFHRLPERSQARVRRRVHPVRWGGLRRFEPIDPSWGLGRGTPIARAYVDGFVERNAQDLRGRVLEVGSPTYAAKLTDRITHVDILDIDPANAEATIIADVADDGSLPAGAFDCIVFTQVLHYAQDVDAALSNLWQSLTPGGVLLLSVPTITKGSAYAHAEDRWRLRPEGLSTVLRRSCPSPESEVVGFGNLLVALGALLGLAAEEFRSDELARHDDDFPIVACARARKPPDSRETL